MHSDIDRKYMAMALELAEKGEGAVNPNPLVGAVVVKNGKIVGKGYHKYYGGPHAEVYALEEAAEEAKGATIYVTLEPCSHYGKTPPCAEKIVKMGIKKCVIAMLDPNPLVAGRGVKILQDAGIEVSWALLEDKATELNRVFLKYIQTGMPYTFLKVAITMDGKIATRSGSSKWITNELSRNRVQKLRNKYMGIMVGIGTVLADDPSLTARVENAINPYRIVIDPKLDTPLEAKLVVNNSDEKTILVTKKKNIETDKYKKMMQNNVKFILIDKDEFEMKEVFSEVGKLNIDSVLVEGGSSVISRCFKENMIDGGEIFIAPKILGDEKATPFIKGFNFDKISDGFELENIRFNTYGNNVSVEFYKE